MASDKLLLSKLGLHEQMTWTPSRQIFDPAIFEIYVSEEYQHSSRKDVDEVYRMNEIVVIHKASGLRLVFNSTEDYNGENVRYKSIDHYIITNENKKLRPFDINIAEEQFIMDNGVIPFTCVWKSRDKH